MAALKQCLAMFFLLLSLPFAIEKKYVRFCLLVLVAIMFHTHSFMFAIVPLLLEKPWGKNIWFLLDATVFAMLTYDSTLGAFMEYAQSKIYRSNFMNMVLFYPAGLLAASLLMRKWPEWCRFILVVTVLAALSAGIEFLQYHFCLGRCEIDDVIHNTAGALLGCLAAMVLPRLLASIKGASEVNKLK